MGKNRLLEHLTKEHDTLDYVDSIYHKLEGNRNVLTIVTRRDPQRCPLSARVSELLQCSKTVKYGMKALPVLDTARREFGERIYDWQSATLETIPPAARRRWLEKPNYAVVVETALSLVGVIINDFASASFTMHRSLYDRRYDTLHLFIRSDLPTKGFCERGMDIKKELLDKFGYDASRFLSIFREARTPIKR